MKKYIYILIEELFHISLGGYLILLLMEMIKEGFVSDFFNLNILLAVVIVSGISIVLTGSGQEQRTSKKTRSFKKEIDYLIGISAGGGMLVYWKTKESGKVAIFIALLSGALIFLISYLILTEGEEFIGKFTPLPKHLLKQLRGKK